MNYLKRGFSKSVKAIEKREGLFVLLVLSQLVFVISLIALSIYFQVKIFEDAQGIIEPLQDANYDANSIEEGKPFTKDMLNIYRSYTSMKHNVIVFLTWLFFLYIVLNGGVWIMTHGLLNNFNLKDHTQILQVWIKHTASVVLILGPFLIISYYLLISMLRMEAAESFSNTANILQYALLALYYFILVAFALTCTRSWKGFPRKVYDLSIKKIFSNFSVLFVNLIILSILGYFVYFTVNNEKTFSLLVLSSILFIIGLVTTRIFWVASLREIQHEKDNH